MRELVNITEKTENYEEMSGLISRPGVVVGGLAAAGITGVCLYLLLKREEEWKLQRQRGLSSSKQVVIDVKIPKESVGVVIGREGSNIREIQAKTDTRINFKDELETGTHRIASIRGLAEDCQMAEVDFNIKILDKYSLV